MVHEKVLAKNYVLKKGIQIIIYFKQENALQRQSVFMKFIDSFSKIFIYHYINNLVIVEKRSNVIELKYN